MSSQPDFKKSVYNVCYKTVLPNSPSSCHSFKVLFVKFCIEKGLLLFSTMVDSSLFFFLLNSVCEITMVTMRTFFICSDIFSYFFVHYCMIGPNKKMENLWCWTKMFLPSSRQERWQQWQKHCMALYFCIVWPFLLTN